MTKARSIVIIGVLFLLATADQVLAWGPATHVGLANSVLERLSLLPTVVAALLARHGCAYLYGSIAADIVFAKRLSRVRQFCHHWSTAFRLLDSAEDDQARAFTYGYLSHLAADTVAHGKYVPHQVVLSGCSVNFGHFYWELRADAAEHHGSWNLLEEVLGGDHADHHRRLEDHITDTFLPYDLNRLLFHRVNAVAMRRNFRRTMSVWSRYSRWDLSSGLLSGYRAESLGRILSLLTDGSGSPVVREDPNGTSALMQIRVRRREVRRLKRRGLPVKRRLLEAARGLAPRPADFRDDPSPATPAAVDDGAVGVVALQA